MSDQDDHLSTGDAGKRAGKPRRPPRNGAFADLRQKNADNPEAGKLTSGGMADLLAIIATNPDDVVRKMAKSAGFPYHVTEKFIKRLRVQGGDFKETVQKLGRRELVEKIQEKIALGLAYMDDFAMSGMDGKDLAIMLGILIEKQQLLEGRPTQILSFEERKHLSDLLPAYVAEARRRGITVDSTAVEVREEPRPMVTLPDRIIEEAISHTARSDVVKKMPSEEKF